MLNAILSLLLWWLWHLLLIAARQRRQTEGFRRAAGGAGSSFGSLPPAQPNHDIPPRVDATNPSIHVSQSILCDIVAQLLSPVDSRSLSNSPLIRLSVRCPPLVRAPVVPNSYSDGSRPAVFFYSLFSPAGDLPLLAQSVCQGRSDIQGQSDIYNIHIPQNNPKQMPESVAQWWNPIAAKLQFANGHSVCSLPKRLGSRLGLTFALHIKGLMRESSPCSRFYPHLPVHSIPLSRTFHSEYTV
ncbi:hypothetical protein EDB80DRAFT_831679 [Ilyonectria destructans]|nr:hypothetical protein EDB80DRAFT_831679 [Ilyonectria destructans]